MTIISGGGWICNQSIFFRNAAEKKKMKCNPSLKSGNVGCSVNLRWLKGPSTSRVAANHMQQPGAHLNGDLEDSPMVDGERECRSGGRSGGQGRGTVHLASPACLFLLGVEREILSSLLIYWCLSSHHGKLVQIYLAADLQGIMSASVPGPKCLSGRLDNARRSRCGENPGWTVQDSNNTPSLGSTGDLPSVLSDYSSLLDYGDLAITLWRNNVVSLSLSYLSHTCLHILSSRQFNPKQ